MSQAAAKNWCFTSFKTDLPIAFDEDTMSYLIYQKEKCPDTNREHFQGYIQLSKKLRLAGVKKLFPDPATHFEKSRGTAVEASAYCRKEESRVDGPWEYGVLTKERQRSDLAKVCEDVSSGVPIRQIMVENPSTFVRNYRGLAVLAESLRPDRNWVTEVHIRWGPADSGKTRYVHDLYPDCYVKSDPKWWSGYEGHETVLIDDIVWPTIFNNMWTLDEMPRKEVLTLFDRYKCSVSVKGGHAKFVARRVFLTSNFDPTPFIESDPAFKRRVTSVTHVTCYVPQSGATDEQVILCCSLCVCVVPCLSQCVPFFYIT